MAALHFWVGNITGYVFSYKKEPPVENPPDRLKYLGCTEDIGWPKRMSTGRILFKPHNRQMKKQRIRRKQLKYSCSDAYTTDTMLSSH